MKVFLLLIHGESLTPGIQLVEYYVNISCHHDYHHNHQSLE